jgi:hypothetical protein
MLHFVTTITILCLILAVVNNHIFNITDRTPSVTLLDGSKAQVEGVKFTLLQSDITTILSVLLAVLRLFSTAWCGGLYWRSALILMEKAGMNIQELKRLASFGLPPSPKTRQRRGGKYIFGLGTILLVLLPLPLSAPIVTGSITWSPEIMRYPVPEVALTASYWNYTYAMKHNLGIAAPNKDFGDTEIISSAAAGFLGWGSSNETNVMGRTLMDANAIRLPVNTTLNNITVPYFEVNKFEWLKNPEKSLTPQQLGVIDPTNSTYWLNISSSRNPLVNLWGYNAALVHDLYDPPRKSWSRTHTFPLVFLVNVLPGSENVTCEWGGAHGWTLSASVPDAPFVQRRVGARVYCYVFANVTYTAGSATCKSCRLSSPLNVQSDTPLQVEDDPSTQYILLLMAQVAFTIREFQELAVLRQLKWDTLDHYIISQLQRTYSAIWTYAVQNNGQEGETGVSLPIPGLRGIVDTKRVWAWFALQMAVTISGVAFIFIQAHVDRTPIQDVTLAAFFIDPSTISPSDGLLQTAISNERKAAVRLRREHGELLSQASYSYPNSI